MRSRLPRRARTLPVALAGLTLVLAGCAKNAPQDSLKPHSHYARTIYHLVLPVFDLAGVVFVIVVGGILFFSLRYRVPSDAVFGDDDMPPQIHGNVKLEIGWSVLPALILLGVGFASVVSVLHLAKVPPAKNPHVEVVAQQWWWEFRYDVNHDGKYNEIVTANELVIPAGTDVDLRMVSRDVIHGFWAPELNGKRDVVPGHPTDFNIAADHPGEYLGQCTVMCGLSHANMRFKVVVLSASDYAKWIVAQEKPAAQPKPGTEAAAGLGDFGTCALCHVVDGNKPSGKPVPLVSGAAPNLTHFMSRSIFASGNFALRKNTPTCTAYGIHYDDHPECIDEAELRAWLLDPPGRLPMAAKTPPEVGRGMPNLNLQPAQVDALVAYLETLK